MAEHLGGSESNFVNMMNQKAKDLGMVNTNFENCHGIDSDNHYTTAKDISIMSRELIFKHPDILKYTSIWMDSLRNGTFGLSSTNKLIRFYEGANGLKTGYTTNARYNLSASATRNNVTFIAVICGAPTSDIRNEEAKQLLDFAFANYEIENISNENVPISKIRIEKSIGNEYEIYTDTITMLKNKGIKMEYDQVVEYYEIKAPIEEGTTIGKITYFERNNLDNIIAESELKIKQNVDRSKFMDYYKMILDFLVM